MLTRKGFFVRPKYVASSVSRNLIRRNRGGGGGGGGRGGGSPPPPRFLLNLTFYQLTISTINRMVSSAINDKFDEW